MQFRVTANVQSRLLLPSAIRFTVDGFTVSLLPDADRLWSSVELVQSVPDYEALIPTVEIGGDGLHHIDMKGGDLVRRSVDLLQYIEALGSFWLEVHRIDWAEPHTEWVPENEAEKERLQILSFQTRREFPEPPKPFEIERLGFLSDRSRDNYLVIPMSFFREGLNDFRQFRFIGAFFHFYFFLEGLYSSGKTKNRQVLASFKRSEQLRQSVERLLSNLTTAPDHMRNLTEEMEIRGWELSVDRVIELLVMMRGQLHHYSSASSLKTGHPLNQAQFETIAFTAMQICVGCHVQLAAGAPPN
jgi:hypothetical protein